MSSAGRLALTLTATLTSFTLVGVQPVEAPSKPADQAFAHLQPDLLQSLMSPRPALTRTELACPGCLFRGMILLNASVCLLPACCACLGVLNYSEWGFYYQLQAVAKPLNLSDPLLTEWKQLEPLAMDLPPGGSHAQFRDPVTPWPMNKSLARQRMPNLVALLDQNTPLQPANTSDGSPAANADDGKTVWITTVGTLQQCVGGAALYVSEDLK